jgi:pyruvate/2-oxoglutarate dehydrogenase complex dihydrolipoamide dehydrogenase (E3) component
LATVLTPDLCVIGAGASGLAVAEAARRLGASVAIVERGEPGKAGRKSGPLALSALAAAAERADLVRTGPAFGVTAEPPKVSFRRVHDHIAEVVALEAPQGGIPRLTALGIEVLRGTGAFVDTRTVKAGDTEIKARRFVIATGASPVVPAVPGLDGVPFFTTETIFDNTRKLSHLVVVGAGPMALELALSYRRLGCEVTVVCSGWALAQSDPELAEIALRRLRDAGIGVHEESVVAAIQPRSQGIGVTIRSGGDVMLAIDASHIFVASGRAANLGALNLEIAGIRRAKADPGTLALNASLRTTNPRVFAVGEAAGHAPAPHLSVLEADLVVRAALLGQPARYEAAAVPRLTLLDPPIAEVGLTEPMARGRFKNAFRVLRASYAESELAQARREGMGVVKLIVTRTGRILGAGICGAGAAELAALFALAIQQHIEVGKLADLAAAHPSYAELARRLGAQAAATSVPGRLQARLLALNRLLP